MAVTWRVYVSQCHFSLLFDLSFLSTKWICSRMSDTLLDSE